MSRILPAVPHFHPSDGAAPVPAYRVTALALLGSMLAIAAAETIIGSLDQADDVAAITEGSGRLAAGGLTLLAAAILLGLATAGLGPIVWRSVTGRIGWILLVIAVPCGGAFAMFHLALLETGAAGLDAAAMEEFIRERFHGPGPWGAPVGYFAVVGLASVLLVLIALVRRRVILLWAPMLFLAGMLMEALLGDGISEIAAHWVMAAGTGVAAHGIWRLGSTATGTIDARAVVPTP